jgi:hypothetical protein
LSPISISFLFLFLKNNPVKSRLTIETFKLHYSLQ